MTELFGRQVILQLDDLSYDGLRVDFSVTKTIGSKLNKAKIDVYNLADIYTDLIESQARDVRVRLLAGYDTPALIFEGNPVKGGISKERSAGDSVLTIEANDGLKQYQDAVVNVSFATQTTFAQVVEEAATQLGLPQGAIEVSNDARLTQGLSFTGPASELLDRVARSQDSDWSIQNGQLRIVPFSGTTTERGPLYSQENRNLIEYQPMDTGAKFVVLLDAKLLPGDRFEVEHQEVQGVYKASKVQHAGSRWQNEFYTTIEATRSE